MSLGGLRSAEGQCRVFIERPQNIWSLGRLVDLPRLIHIPAPWL